MRIAIVVQRYGTDINGGAELHARLLAERLAARHGVDIITTKSKSYVVWDNELDKDYEIINGLPVYRFASHKKNKFLAHRFYRLNRDLSKISIFFRKLGWKKLATSRILRFHWFFRQWLRHQGPYCPSMMDFIKQKKNYYDVFIYFTYLYYPTNAGINITGKKSILIPTAHDEKPFYFTGYAGIFEKAGYIMYNSIAEKQLVENTYPSSKRTANDIAGVGIDAPHIKKSKPVIEDPYFVYIGRLDRAKNVHELADFFKKYKDRNNQARNLKLVLIGKAEKNLPETDHPDIIQTGFISDEEKNRWLQHARALIIPSKHESLSMVTLEAMNAGIPVIANASSKVLEDHIRVSKAGFAYENYMEFERALNRILTMTENQRKIMKKKGIAYVKNNYQWEAILQKFEKAFAYIQQLNDEKHLVR